MKKPRLTEADRTVCRSLLAAAGSNALSEEFRRTLRDSYRLIRRLAGIGKEVTSK